MLDQQTLVILAILGILDYVWIVLLNQDNYNTIVRAVQGTDISLRPVAAGLAYLLMTWSIRYMVLPHVDPASGNDRWWQSLRWGGGLALVAYGLFNLTNLAILDGWTWQISLMDTLWGVGLFTVTTYLVTITATK